MKEGAIVFVTPDILCEPCAQVIEYKNGFSITNRTDIKTKYGDNITIDWGSDTTRLGTTNNIEINTTNTNKEMTATKYGISAKEALNMQSMILAVTSSNGGWINADRKEIQNYCFPTQEDIDKYKYQFMNLSALAGISESSANNYLKGKGILDGKGKAFLEAAKEHKVNEIYLMAHACLETGNGSSKLAKGVDYNGTTVYNMFGIGAYDSDPINGGAKYAYNHGWTTPNKAIKGGAKFISEEYINRPYFNQNTLYKMRWNPASPGNHQYATDVGWAAKQSVWIQKIYESFADAKVTFELPLYRGTF